MIGNPNDKTNFPYKLLLTKRQVENLRKAFANKSSTDIKLPKTKLSKLIQSRGFVGRLLVPLLKTGLPLMKNIIQLLVKSVWTPLGLTAAASAADAGIHKKMLGSGIATLIISNDEMKDIIKIVKYLNDSCLLFKRVSKISQNEAKEEKGGFFSMLLVTLDESLFWNILTV